MTTTLHNRLGKKTSRRARYTVPVVVCALAMIVALQIVHAKDALLSELQKGQATEGLSIVSTNTASAGVFFFGDNKFHETRILPSVLWDVMFVLVKMASRLRSVSLNSPQTFTCQRS